MPAILKSLSTGDDEAGMARTSLASIANRGYLYDGIKLNKEQDLAFFFGGSVVMAVVVVDPLELLLLPYFKLSGA